MSRKQRQQEATSGISTLCLFSLCVQTDKENNTRATKQLGNCCCNLTGKREKGKRRERARGRTLHAKDRAVVSRTRAVLPYAFSLNVALPFCLFSLSLSFLFSLHPPCGPLMQAPAEKSEHTARAKYQSVRKTGRHNKSDFDTTGSN